jgi:hypothetical protein
MFIVLTSTVNRLYVKQVPQITANEKGYQFPQDRQLFINDLKSNIRQLIPTTPGSYALWRTLTRLCGTDWILDVISFDLDVCKPAELLNWTRLAEQLKLMDVVEYTNKRMATMDAVSSFNEEQFNIELTKTITVQITTERKARNYGTLTSINLTSQMCASIISQLGTVYNLSAMIEADIYRGSWVKYELHKKLLDLLQKYGLDKVGLPNQEYLEEKNKSKYSKARIIKILELTGKPSSPTPKKAPVVKKGKIANPSAKLEDDEPIFKELLNIAKSVYLEEQGLTTNEELDSLLHENKTSVPVHILLLNKSVNSIHSGKIPSKGDTSQIAGWISDSLLRKGDFISTSGNATKYTVMNAKDAARFDPWQRQMISLVMAKKSVLVSCPTSGGKTYSAMVTIEWILKQRNDIVLAFISPTFHLALQTYSNIIKTFPTMKASLIAGNINVDTANAQIYVGTPSELWVYMTTTKKNFNIGIFDEIHTISTSFDQSVEAQIRAEAIDNLLGICTDQFIGLSATIHDDDLDILCDHVKLKTKIPVIDKVVYTQRTIPLKEYVFTQGNIVSVGALPSQNEDISFPAVTPMTTFNLFKQLDTLKITPSLVFDELESDCYTNYVDMVEWLEKQEQIHYAHYLTIGEEVNILIDNVNMELNPLYNDVSNSRTTAAKEAIRPRLQSAEKSRHQVISKVIQIFKTHMQVILKEPITAVIDNTTIPIRYLVKMDSILSKRHAETFGRPPPELVTVEYRDLMIDLANYRDLELSNDQASNNNVAPLSRVCVEAGPYFQLGQPTGEMDVFRSMQVSDGYGSDAKNRKILLSLCEAERIKVSDVKPLLSLIDRGLRYGIAIVIPQLPFVIQYYKLLLISKRKLPVVFASISMSMGINYPFKCVILRPHTNNVNDSNGADINICTGIQAIGRAGRRGLDSVGHAIYWGVSNFQQMKAQYLPRITLPVSGKGRGCLILDPIKTAIKIDINRLLEGDNINVLTSTISRLDPKGQMGIYAGLNFDTAFDTEIPVTDNNEFSKVTSTASTSVPVKINDVGLITAITGCVGPLADDLQIEYTDLNDTIIRIQKIALDEILTSFKNDAYATVERMTRIKRAIQELHTRLHRSSATELLKHLVSVFELIHRTQHRQLRL